MADNPVTPSVFRSLIPSAAGAACDKFLRALFTFPSKFSAWYSFVYNEDGTFTDDFKATVCAIDCSAVDAGTGGLSAPTLTWAAGSPVHMSWTSVPGAAYYELARSTSNNIATATLITATTLLNFDDSTVADATWYFYWVRAKTAAAVGPYSPVQMGGQNQTQLAAPTVTPTTNIVDHVYLSWATIAGAADYKVYRNTSDTLTAAVLLATTTGRFWNDFTGGLGVSYYYIVLAHNPYNTGSKPTGVVGIRQ